MGGKEALIENQVVFEHQANRSSEQGRYRDRRPGLHGTGGARSYQFDRWNPVVPGVCPLTSR